MHNITPIIFLFSIFITNAVFNRYIYPCDNDTRPPNDTRPAKQIDSVSGDISTGIIEAIISIILKLICTRLMRYPTTRNSQNMVALDFETYFAHTTTVQYAITKEGSKKHAGGLLLK